VVSAQNGLNELAIAEVVGAARTVGAFVNFGADYLEPGVIHYGGHGAVVVGEIDGRITPRVTAIRDAWRRFEAPRRRHAQHLGISLGQGSLWRDALCHGADQRIHRRCARHARVPARSNIALAREILAVAAARGVQPEAFDGFDPGAYLAERPDGAAERSLDALVAHQPAIGQVV
jgi:2-dehydropantoate 2-reductase